MKVIIYHNPRCSKSRQTLQLLQDRGFAPEIIEYLNTPPDKTEIQEILNMLDLNARDLMRTKESIYEKQGLDNEKFTTDELIAEMIKYPVLIERPIVVNRQQAVIGRPAENILNIL